MDNDNAFTKAKQQKQINNANNANLVSNVANVAEHSGDPTAMAIGKGVKTADKLTGGKASQKIGKALTTANKMNGLQGKMLQNAINKSAKNGMTDKLSKAMTAKNGKIPQKNNNSSLNSDKSNETTDDTTSSSDTLGGDGLFSSIFNTSKIVKFGLMLMIPFSVITIIMCVFSSASQIFIKSIGLGSADSISDKDAEKKINKKQKDTDSLNEEVTEDDLSFEISLPQNSNLVFTAKTKYLKRKYNEATLDELEDFYPPIANVDGENNKNLVYDFYFKMYNLYISYKDNYGVILDLPLLMATLDLQSSDMNQIFKKNLSKEDRKSTARKRPTKQDPDNEFDYLHDWSNYTSTKKESTHDMEIIAQHMISQESYDETKKNCDDPKDGFCYVIDEEKFKEFLKEYIEKKYYLDGYTSEKIDDSKVKQQSSKTEIKTSECSNCTAFTEKFITWLIKIANDDSHGYSQKNRAGGIDYDCSSLVYFGLLNSGFTTSQIGSYPFSTKNGEREKLKKAGFQEISFKSLVTNKNDLSKLKAGDILWTPGHTEVYIGKNMNVGAHESENGGTTGKYGDQTGNEISVTKYWDDNWQYVYRYNR